MQANWAAVLVDARSGLAEIASTISAEALSDFQHDNDGLALGALLTHPIVGAAEGADAVTARPSEITACLRVLPAGGEQRLFSTVCTGKAGKNAPYCPDCGGVRKALRPRVMCDRNALVDAGRETAATRNKRGLTSDDNAALRARNKQLQTDLLREQARTRKICLAIAAGRGGAIESITMTRTLSRAEAQAVYDDMRAAESTTDDDGADMHSIALPRNSLRRTCWDTCISNLGSQLKTGNKNGFR